MLGQQVLHWQSPQQTRDKDQRKTNTLTPNSIGLKVMNKKFITLWIKFWELQF